MSIKTYEIHNSYLQDAPDSSGITRMVSEADYLTQLEQTDALKTSLNNIINAFGISGEGAHSKLVIEYVMGLAAERDTLAAENCIQDFIITAVKDLARESEGVIGWHLNGDVASWDEVLPELSHSETPATDAFTAELRAPTNH